MNPTAAAVVVIFALTLTFVFTGLVVWYVMHAHIKCVEEINKAWELSSQAVIHEREVSARDRAALEQWLVALAGQVSDQGRSSFELTQSSQKLTQAVVTLWEQGKVSTIG